MDQSLEKTSQVRIHLTTRDDDLKLPEETGPILVSTNLRRYALSTLVNSLLESEKPTPFEFLINGQFLRDSIDEFLTANGISSEMTVPVEYVRALNPPLQISSLEHDDWVSSVDVLSPASEPIYWAGGANPLPREARRIISGSYDGLVRVWSTSTDLLAASPPAANGGHTQPIKSVRFLLPSKLVSCGNDRSIRIWNYLEEDHDAAGQPKASSITPSLELYGHKSSVDSIAVHAPSCHILSASSDHSVGLWSTRKAEAPAAPPGLLPAAFKRRKLGTMPQIPQRGPLNMLASHTAPVSAAVFSAKDAGVAYSTSWDHTLLTWDLITSTAVSTRRTLHPLLCVTELPQLGLLAAGSSARHISMIDPRVDARDVTSLTLRGHSGAVVSAAFEPGKAWGLVSASLDGTCRLWDVRSTRVDAKSPSSQACESTHVIRRDNYSERKRGTGDGNKVFDVCWDADVGIVSAGEDKKVEVYQATSR